MENKLYGTQEFILWLAYAMWHALVIYYVNFVCLTATSTYIGHEGKDIGFWVSGHVVYGATIVVTNSLIIMKFNNFTGYGEICVGLMIAAYFLFLGLESLFTMFPQVYGIFGPTFGCKLVWLGLIFISA